MTLPLEDPEVVQAADAIIAAADESTFVPPMLPVVAQEALLLARDKNVDLRKLGKLVERDQVLASRFLMVANSPLYRGSSQITTVSAALMRLGLTTSRDLVFFTAIEPVLFKSKIFEREMHALREHSLATATACSFLTRALPHKVEEATLAGLLHDLGAGAALSYVSRNAEKFARVRAVQGGIIAAIQRAHVVAGRSVARRWALPEAVARAIGEHHTPAAGQPLIVLVTAAADELATTCKMGWGLGGFDGVSALEILAGDPRNAKELTSEFAYQVGAAAA